MGEAFIALSLSVVLECVLASYFSVLFNCTICLLLRINKRFTFFATRTQQADSSLVGNSNKQGVNKQVLLNVIAA